MASLKGKTCLITGANAGLGKATALGLAKLGATVIMVCRSWERGESALKEIVSKSNNASVHLLLADLSSQKSIRELAAEFMNKFAALHVLVNNAGVSLLSRNLTVDGCEETFATNHLGPFLLTSLLLPIIKSSAPARIINTASMAHRRAMIDFNDLMGEKSFSGGNAYSRSKLANVMFTYELAERLKGTGVTVNAFCPGGVATQIWRHFNPVQKAFFRAILKTPEDAARLPIYLATAPELDNVTGRYFEFKNHLRVQELMGFLKFDVTKAETRSSAFSYDRNAAKKLWDISEKMTGISK
jgi:NAD(P)-dependent dehydrogenase (short-subunit alcohol dehydrogenase family)